MFDDSSSTLLFQGTPRNDSPIKEIGE